MVLNLPKDKTKTHAQLYAQARAETDKRRKAVLLQQAKSIELSTSLKSYTRRMKTINQQVKNVKKDTTKDDAWKKKNLGELAIEKKAESRKSKNATIKCTNNKCKVKSITCKSGHKKDPETKVCQKKRNEGQSKPKPMPQVCALGLLTRPRCVVSDKTGIVSPSQNTNCQLRMQNMRVAPRYTIVNEKCRFTNGPPINSINNSYAQGHRAPITSQL